MHATMHIKVLNNLVTSIQLSGLYQSPQLNASLDVVTGGCARLAPDEAALQLAIANSFVLSTQSQCNFLVFIVNNETKCIL